MIFLITGCFPQTEELLHRPFYILHAKRGVLFPKPTTLQAEGRLTLFDVEENVILFSEKRELIPLSTFLNDWIKGLRGFEEGMSGTAYLFFENIEQEYRETVVRISDPYIDPIKGTVSFNTLSHEGYFPFHEIEMKDVMVFLTLPRKEI